MCIPQIVNIEKETKNTIYSFLVFCFFVMVLNGTKIKTAPHTQQFVSACELSNHRWIRFTALPPTLDKWCH